MGNYFCPEPEPHLNKRPRLLSDKSAKTNSTTNPPPSINEQTAFQKLIRTTVLQPDKKLSLQDFVLKGVLGEGGFATVYVAELKQNIKKGIKKQFALKRIGKKKLKQRKVIQNLKIQKKVYSEIRSNFIISLNYAFQDKSFCYFVMQSAVGGDIYSFISSTKQPSKSRMYKLLGQQGARFIFACVILGIECAHKHNIMYRDLKPQNVLVFKNGYPKLTDFGLAKQIKVDQVSKTMAGTKIYFAPQIVQKKGHTKAVDFWTLGVFLHQLILYCPPFDGHLIVPSKFKNLCLKAEKNREWRSEKISPEAKNLINSFLKVNPQQRLGMNGFEQIKNHSFFKGLDWQALSEMKLQSPLLGIVQQYQVTPKSMNSSKQQQLIKETSYQIQGLTYVRTLSEQHINVS